MKLRALLLAGATVLALSAPAAANGDGWYLGLGMGWDTAQLVHLDSPPPVGTFHGAFNDDVLGTAAFGYKWDNLRAEFEGGYDQRAFHRANGVAGTMAGGLDVTSGMFNLAYDLPVWENLSLTFGGGVGFGDVHPHVKTNGSGWYVHGSNTGFMWQGIAGLNYDLGDSMDLFLDWRYRAAETDHDFALGHHWRRSGSHKGGSRERRVARHSLVPGASAAPAATASSAPSAPASPAASAAGVKTLHRLLRLR